VVREKNVWHRTANRWTPDVMRAEQVTALRRAEVEQMRRYVEHTECLMEFLARALDDPAPVPCGKCMNCSGQTTRQPLPAELTHRAVEFLRGDALMIKPRIRWPLPVLEELRETPPQKEMQNSVTQLRNLLGAFAVRGAVPAGPVLLVDDLVDSGWTLTVLAVLLRQHGSGPVYPLALAKSSPRSA
jgi:hypothetical protein